MRSLLALGLFITLSASAGAAMAHHPRHLIIHSGRDYGVPVWGYRAVRPPAPYDDTPSYDDPSKFGGGTAL